MMNEFFYDDNDDNDDDDAKICITNAVASQKSVGSAAQKS